MCMIKPSQFGIPQIFSHYSFILKYFMVYCSIISFHTGANIVQVLYDINVYYIDIHYKYMYL